MDSENVHAFGIAGKELTATGTSFTSDAWQFGSEFRLGLDGRERPPGSHRRSADGDGR